MNSKLQKLAEQAGFYGNPTFENLETFAELLVQECADICANGTIEKAIGLMYSKEIKKNFGVK